jgi:hypothetical protein
MAKCEHFNFVIHHDVLRLARVEGGPIEQYVMAGGVHCYDCGLEFRPFRILLEPMNEAPRKKSPLLIPQRIH